MKRYINKDTVCIMFCHTEITTHPQDKLVPVKSTVDLTCTSLLSSDVTFSWIHNGKSISRLSTIGDTSILTITSVRYRDAGSYVCTVTSGSLSVMSDAATLTVYGKILQILLFGKFSFKAKISYCIIFP